MSAPVQTSPTAVGVFQSHFGILPGSQDASQECNRWRALCDELLQELARLRTEIEQRRLEELLREPIPDVPMEAMYAEVDRDASLEGYIASLRKELEAEQ